MLIKGVAANKVTGERHTFAIERSPDEWMDSIVPCSGPCECGVEPGGTCSEGWPSVLLVAGLI